MTEVAQRMQLSMEGQQHAQVGAVGEEMEVR